MYNYYNAFEKEYIPINVDLAIKDYGSIEIFQEMVNNYLSM
jgi:hypothetical protein